MKIRRVNVGEYLRAPTVNALIDNSNKAGQDNGAKVAADESKAQTDDQGTNATPENIERDTGALVNDNYWTPISVETSTERVENPEDSEQYVDVLRIDKIVFENAAGEQLTLADIWSLIT